MKLLSKTSIIFYSILGIFSLFIARGIRDLLDYSLLVEIIITSAIIIPMYMVCRKILMKFSVESLSLPGAGPAIPRKPRKLGHRSRGEEKEATGAGRSRGGGRGGRR